MKKILLLLSSFILIFSLSSCKGTKSDKVVIQNLPQTIWVGESITLTGRYSGDNGRYFYEWSSSDTSVATVKSTTDGAEVVYSDATLTALKRGKTTITLKIYAKGKNSKPFYKEYSLQVIDENDLPDVENFGFDFSELTLKIGETFDLTPKVSPSNAVFKESVTYSSDNSDIVSIDFTGKITGISKGSTVITATYNGKSVNIDVTVMSVSDSIDVTIAGIKNPEKIHMQVGQRLYYSVVFTPSGTDTKTYDFFSGDSHLLFAGKGYINALMDGTTTLTIYSQEYPGLKRDITVIITDPNKQEPIFPKPEDSSSESESETEE